MVLSDKTIKEEIKNKNIIIDPLGENAIQPASVDVRLDENILVFRNTEQPYIDVKNISDELTDLIKIKSDKPFILHPNQFVLGSTLEYVEIPNHLVSRLEGKSSLGRVGLLIHSTAGYVDPGFKGNLTLELSNVSNLPITLYKGMKIGQMSFTQLTTPVETYRAYRTWIHTVCLSLPVKEIALVDEPTAAAMGAGVPPGAKLLVVDIGGGTIDLSLVGLEGGEGKAAPIAQLHH